MNAVDNATVQMLQRHWEEGWHRSDVERIMAPLDEDVVFSSPGVAMLTGDPPKMTISGRDALRAYIEDALQTHVGSPVHAAGHARRHRQHRPHLCVRGSRRATEARGGLDARRPDHTVVEWRCHY